MCACVQWVERGRRRSCVLYFHGLWRNLPVRLELREEEPVGCGTPDKGDTLTLDHWSAGRSRQLESLTFQRRKRSTTPGLLLCVCVFWKSLSEREARVCQLYGFVCELRDVCVRAAVATCCPECVEVCGLVCSGWKSGAGTTNSSSLSFYAMGGCHSYPSATKADSKTLQPSDISSEKL